MEACHPGTRAFLSFDGTRQKQGATGLYTVPTDDLRAGDFSKYPNIIYDPTTGNPDGTGRQPFAGNIYSQVIDAPFHPWERDSLQ